MEAWLETAPGWIQKMPASFEWLQSIIWQVYRTFIENDRWKVFYLSGLKVTFIVTIGSLLLGVIIGLVLAVIRTVNDSYTAKKPPVVVRILNKIAKIYITVLRGTPMMVQLLIMYLVIMVPKTDTMTMLCGIITLGMNSGAYVAEIIRGGLMAVDKGQMEAGRSLGFSYLASMWHFVIPQAIKSILPALGNEMITLFKDTSLVSVIALRDITKQTQNVVSKIYIALVPYISLAIIYLFFVIIMTKLLEVFERRLRKSDH